MRGDIFVLAGYVASAENWTAFSEEWQAHLKASPPLKSFKMNKMRRSLKRAEGFYHCIERNVSLTISITMYVDQLNKVNQSMKWPAAVDLDDGFENPFYFASKAIIDKLAREQRQFGITEPVNFIFDERTDKRRALEGYDLIKRSSAPEFRQLMGDTPKFKDDEEVLPLQAADLWTWWVSKWEE